jgi:hypothetical protein
VFRQRPPQRSQKLALVGDLPPPGPHQRSWGWSFSCCTALVWVWVGGVGRVSSVHDEQQRASALPRRRCRGVGAAGALVRSCLSLLLANLLSANLLSVKRGTATAAAVAAVAVVKVLPLPFAGPHTLAFLPTASALALAARRIATPFHGRAQVPDESRGRSLRDEAGG